MRNETHSTHLPSLVRPKSRVVPFPGSSRIAQNEARLAAARRILRDSGDHDTFTLCMASNTLAELGTPSDVELADLILAQTTAHLDRPPAPPPAGRPHPAITLAVALGTALLALAILHDAPARVAETLVQFEAMKGGGE
jgi:hypothetical protein